MKLIIIISFFVLFIFLVILGLLLSGQEPDKKVFETWKAKENYDLKFYKSDSFYIKVDRNSSIGIAIDQLTDMIKYLIAAASGFLIFIANKLINFANNNKKNININWLIVACIVFIVSMSAGLFALGQFIYLATSDYFSLEHGFGSAVLYQFS